MTHCRLLPPTSAQWRPSWTRTWTGIRTRISLWIRDHRSSHLTPWTFHPCLVLSPLLSPPPTVESCSRPRSLSLQTILSPPPLPPSSSPSTSLLSRTCPLVSPTFLPSLSQAHALSIAFEDMYETQHNNGSADSEKIVLVSGRGESDIVSLSFICLCHTLTTCRSPTPLTGRLSPPRPLSTRSRIQRKLSPSTTPRKGPLQIMNRLSTLLRKTQKIFKLLQT